MSLGSGKVHKGGLRPLWHGGETWGAVKAGLRRRRQRGGQGWVGELASARDSASPSEWSLFFHIKVRSSTVGSKGAAVSEGGEARAEDLRRK